MKRIIEGAMLDWKESSRRKPLIVRGARQVGKTWLVENFLAKGFGDLPTLIKVVLVIVGVIFVLVYLACSGAGPGGCLELR